jgi:F420-dependent oxidoreductase-like protein
MQNLRIGVGGRGNGIDAALEEAKRAEEAGFQSLWFSNIFAHDALTLIALAGRATERIELGTAVVPTHSRHPLYMAQQALSTNAACGGRLALGIGPSHKVVIENMLGLSFEKPARHVREYVQVLKALLEEGRVKHEGQVYRVQGQLHVPGATPCPVLIGGLGKLMRRIAGGLADGTLTWMTGRRTLAEEIGPDVRAAAEEAGRPAPRIVAALPVCVTDDEAAAREAIDKVLAMYPSLPSYKAMLDLEGATRPSDIALVGDESSVADGVRALADAGVTDFNASIIGAGGDAKAAAERTWQLMAELARGEA